MGQAEVSFWVVGGNENHKKPEAGAGEMAWQLRVSIPLPEDPSLIPSMHTKHAYLPIP